MALGIWALTAAEPGRPPALGSVRGAGNRYASRSDVGRLQRQIAGSGQDIRIAILPDSAGDPVTVLQALNDRIGAHGVLGAWWPGTVGPARTATWGFR